ncbi:MAG TPA: hypothetical protein VEU98_07165, partial [Candidatus Eremiobacteraceae bacterium]|nr:hypothetical protein [Candidatus Eremiobacteraceae bacterium]
ATLVFYMPGKEFEALQRQLFDAGLSEDLPCLLVSQAARSEQKLIRTTLGNLSLLPSLPAPNLLLIGSTVAEARAEEAVTYSASGAEQKLFAEITLDLPEIRETISDKLTF